MFIPTAEIVIKTEKQTDKANSKIGTQLIIVQARIISCSTNLNTYMPCYIFSLIK